MVPVFYMKHVTIRLIHENRVAQMAYDNRQNPARIKGFLDTVLLDARTELDILEDR